MASFSDADIKKFEKFLDDYIPEHFKFEEKEIFPVILKNKTQEEKALVQELKNQHNQISDMIGQLKELISKYGLQASKDQMDNLMVLKIKIIEELLAHASEEELKLLPLLKKYEIDLK